MNRQLETALRAARHNPVWKPACVYVVAEDNGQTVYDASGELQYDLAEETYGFIDRTKETTFTATPTYEGATIVTILSEVAPNGAAVVLIEDTFYSIHSVHSADAMGISVRYVCHALPETDLPLIRWNML